MSHSVRRVTDATRVLRPSRRQPQARRAVKCVRLELAVHHDGRHRQLEDDERYSHGSRVEFKPRKQRHGGLNRRDRAEGNRNNALYWAARRAKDDQLLQDVHDELADAAVTSGLDERAVQTTISSAERAA